MKWLKSTTQKVWTVKGRIIPACITPHNDYLVLNDSEFSEISSIPVIKSLINAGGILVYNEEPVELKNDIDSLKDSKAELQAQVTNLQEQLKQKEAALQAAETRKNDTVDIEKIKEEAVAELKAEAIKELQEKEDKIKSLEATAAEKDKEIAKLERALAKAKADK